MVKVGDKIKIINMVDEPQCKGKVGVVELIDDIGQLHGTWGGCALIPGVDSFKIITDDSKEENKENITEATIADKVDEKNIGNGVTVFSGKGDIEEVLDRALRVNKREIKYGGNEYVNVLLIGFAGTGKTARTIAWAKKNGINLVSKYAATMDDVDVGGATTPSKDGLTAVKLGTTEFDSLGKVENSVLFLDELNRAPRSVRGTLLTLINNHTIPDPREESGMRYLPNYLFTIVSINPPNSDYQVDQLDDAEIGRMFVVYVKADKAVTLDYIKAELQRFIGSNPTEEDKLIFEKQMRLATKIIMDPRFFFDNQDDINASKDPDKGGNGLVTSPRNFVRLLKMSEGDKEFFINNWSNTCGSLKQQTIKEILKDYKDTDDKANQALKQGTDSAVFANKKDRYANMAQAIKSRNI